MGSLFGGLQVIVRPTWVTGYAWRKLPGNRPPAKAKGRKGTRRDWKRSHPRGLRWRCGPVEPDHVLHMGDKIICTHRQAAAIREAVPHA